MTIHSSINHLADQNRSGCILCTNTTPLRVLDYPEFSVCCPVPEAVGLLTLPSRWLLANLPPSLSRTHSLTQTHARAHTHNHTHTHLCLHTYHTLSAPGCQDTGERQRCHCVALYYTWNSEPHAFLIEVICTGTAWVGVYSVSETVLAPIYILL